MPQWNGISLLRDEETPSVLDALGSWGCGTFWATCWFQLQWLESLHNHHITIKELIPIVTGAAVWGQRWTSSHMRVRCDNAAVVHILNQGYSRDSDVMHLMRCLHFFVASFDLHWSAEHIQGSLSLLDWAADALSWNSFHIFQELVLTAEQPPTPIPSILTTILMVVKPDWLSTDWTAPFTSI